MTPRPRSRRPRGTGQIRRTKHGRFEAVFTRGGRSVSRTFATLTDAQDWLSSQGSRPPPPRGRCTLAAFRATYREDMLVRQLSDETIKHNLLHLDAVIREWPDLCLADVTVARLKAMIRDMHRLEWRPATVRNRIGQVTASYRLAAELELVEPRAFRLRLPRVTRESRPPAYTQEEVEALLAAADTAELRVAIGLGAWAGLRAAEIRRARWQDVDRLRRVLIVPVRSKVDQPKGRRERVIPAPQRLLDAVEAVAAVDYLIGAKMGDTVFRRWLAPVFRRAGLRGVRLHRLRHYWASACANAGAHPLELMAWAGWEDPGLVQRYYHGPDLSRGALVDRAF